MRNPVHPGDVIKTEIVEAHHLSERVAVLRAREQPHQPPAPDSSP